ncbi:MATE family efflux transporter [Parabacteroides gordonii]|jgi:putative MATE family efflux protein|uniref:Multidrug-efflux transporter n=1 Tax=Parabacteroides gordonii MS-1 = DSM 23371 TaxID=1203610 RepID=A0A0F5IKW3_9BACT|nr:MATE family efflux transporter [Parabacteroides gordonii]KKB45762.1 MATE efflux family protein [Parabacteroides gordonii MS-1 = DSM 23371]MCA5586273.1 MATE family efflux transporter [Parabacteroides gordonii]MCD8135442.1 MATE family efflux transporter [Parabacteroides gordonii]RGP18645.1 MATE family efflux transporter [Parabacteroides gordonii]
MTHDLTHGSVWKVIVRFALPLLIGNLLQQLYNVTDSIIVGQFLGKEALAAVSASFFIYYFIISLVIGVGSGTSVVVSQFFGAKQYDKVQRAFSSFFIFMLVAGIALSIAGIIFAEPIFRLTNTPEEVIPDAVAYFRIYIGGTFLFVTFNSIISILRGVGESVRPMIFIFITTILNIVLDLLFIVGFHWGIEGAARATVIAQGIGMCIALGYVNNTHPLLSIKKQDLLFDMKLFKEGLKIGLPTSVQQCAIALGLIALLGIVNSFGTDTLTAYGAAGKIDTIITQAVLTLSGALAAFCGQNIGAGRFDRVRKGLRFTMLVNVIFSLITFTAIYFFGEEMMRAFTNDPAVIAIGKEYLLIIGGFFIVHGALNIYNGALRGAGDTIFTMATSLLCLWLIRIPLAYQLSAWYGRQGIWWAIGISIAIGLVITYIYYKMDIWKKRCVVK